MEVKIPDALKAGMPQNLWGKLLATTPVVMAVISTMLAGLSSSEMTRAQYDRSLAAQQQSKAGDQWGYFQAKRLRGTALKTSRDLLLAATETGRFAPNAVTSTAVFLGDALRRCEAAARDLQAALGSAGGAGDKELTTAVEGYLKGIAQRTPDAGKLVAELNGLFAADGTATALGFLGDGVLPTPAAAPPVDAGLKTILDAVEEDRSMAELEPLLAKVSHSDVEEELRAARDRTREFDVRLGPVNRVTDQLEAALARQLTLLPDSQMQFVAGLAAAVPADADPNVRRTAGAFVTACRAVQADTVRQVYRDFTSARLRYAAARYDAEARLNQVIANLYEVQVRKNNLSAERHHTRSQRFFYGMLAAQMAVIMATFAMAARKRNLLWGLAAAAGVAAVAFAAYVYLYV